MATERSAHSRLIQAAALLTGLDRFAAAPMLAVIAASFGQPLERAVGVASLYYLLYGAAQPLWGIGLDRWGRLTTMRASLRIAGVTGLYSALGWTLGLVVVARAATGAMMAAVVPAGLVYIGDTAPSTTRQRDLASLSAMVAVGSAIASLTAGLAAERGVWRLAFAVPGCLALAMSSMLGRVPEPARRRATPSLRAQLAELASGRQLWLLLALGLGDGGLILGVSTLFATVVQEDGRSAAIAGSVVAVFGVAVLAWSRVVRFLVGRWSVSALLASGALVLAVGYFIAAVPGSGGEILVATTGVAGGWSFIHSSLQTWANEAMPHLRALTVSCFSASVFVGSALATMLATPGVVSGHSRAVFVATAGAAVGYGASAVVARRRYEGRGARPVNSDQPRSTGGC